MHLERASDRIPPDLVEMLRELGGGESGFWGTSFGRGETATIEAYLRLCQDGDDPAKVSSDFVPQTIFWMIDDAGRAVGMVRARHQLNERLLQDGGHVGYYVRRSERRKGYAASALRQAVDFLRTLGVTRVLVTADPHNDASIRTVLSVGGVPDGQGRNLDSGDIVNRYWIA